MQVLGIGIDMVAVSRVARALGRWGDRFRSRLLSATEREELEGRALVGAREAEFLAGRWAAKEAVAKALGTGLSRLGWANIEVLGAGAGPRCWFGGEAAGLARHLGVRSVLVSITHEAGFAAACAVTLGDPGERP